MVAGTLLVAMVGPTDRNIDATRQMQEFLLE
jgi:hypothetical protein